MYYASICAIAKDEDQDIVEWLRYHFAIGFEHILIYDNNSQIPLRDSLRAFMDAGLVTVIDLPLTQGQQLSAYVDALREWGRNTFWLAFIDIDEFILPVQNNDIRDLLDDYSDFAGLAANWNMFSSNGHISRPQGGVLENYTECLGLNPHIKSVVRPGLATHPRSPHHFHYRDGHYCVNEDKIPVSNFHTYPLADKICINHYYYKSQQDFHAKIARGPGSPVRNCAGREIGTFYGHLQQRGVYDGRILRFQPQVARFGRLPAQAIADMVKFAGHNDLERGLRDIDEAMKRGDLAKASRIHRMLRRCHDDIDLDIIGANLAFLEGRHEGGLELLRQRMSRPGATDEDLRACYAALANHYALAGQPQARDAIGAYLGGCGG